MFFIVEKFQLIGFSDKKTSIHTRIIWSCSWSPDSKYFITGSRDKKIVSWGREDPSSAGDSAEQWSSVGKLLETSNSVTAVAFSPKIQLQDEYTVAAGYENGEIEIYSWKAGTGKWELHHLIDKQYPL